ncbi:hypothetical protein GCM10020331_036950 [Ectobacillus funiculus]
MTYQKLLATTVSCFFIFSSDGGHSCFNAGGATIIVKEERDKTAEFLLAKPISRSGIVTAKLMAACVNLVVLNGITMLTSIQMVSYYSKGATQTHDIIVLMIGMFFSCS